MRVPLVGMVGPFFFLAAVAAAPQAAGEGASHRVMAGRPGYDTGGLHNLFMGSGYRKLWVTPIDYPVLDLTAFAGGLRPVDAGRVFLEEDPSDAWHASYGGGVFFQMLTLNTVFHAAVAHGDEGTRFYVDYGFAF